MPSFTTTSAASTTYPDTKAPLAAHGRHLPITSVLDLSRADTRQGFPHIQPFKEQHFVVTPGGLEEAAKMSATSNWRPEEAPLRQLLGFLNDSLSGRDLNVQRKAEMVSKSNVNMKSIHS